MLKIPRSQKKPKPIKLSQNVDNNEHVEFLNRLHDINLVRVKDHGCFCYSDCVWTLIDSIVIYRSDREGRVNFNNWCFVSIVLSVI